MGRVEGEGAVQVLVFDRQSLVAAEEFDGSVVLGRQSAATEGLYSRRVEGGRWRMVVAGMGESEVSRRQVVVEPGPEGRVRLANASASVPVRLGDGGEIAPGAALERSLPADFHLGRRRVEVRTAGSEGGESAIRRLGEATIGPTEFAGSGGARSLPALDLGGESGEGVAVGSLLRWLQAVVLTLQTANRSTDFFATAARSVVEALAMDVGCVLLRRGDGWAVEARHLACPGGVGADDSPCRELLETMTEEKRTLWREPRPVDDGATVAPGTSVVVAPILDRRCEVIGALYGERQPGGCAGPAGARIRTIDAMLLELLASGLAAAMARVELEKSAVAAKARFEQFFTPELADELAARPDLLTGREVLVTLLFCDIRDFSAVSERVGPARTVEWVGDVMGVLSDCVQAHHGVLVDYIGDELIAMWGAPKHAPDHARLACQAALDMVDRLPEIDARWKSVIGAETDVGIGVNTGLAQVGNVGTDRKFKYGALGNTVNLASRVQGATRYLKTRLLVTGPTHDRLGGAFPSRRLGKALVVHIAEPVELYELSPRSQAGWADVRGVYEAALAHFEGRRFREATRALANLLADHPHDGPSLILLSRAVECLVLDPADFDPVWKVPGK